MIGTPEIMAAILDGRILSAPERQILLCEGEMALDALEMHGEFLGSASDSDPLWDARMRERLELLSSGEISIHPLKGRRDHD